MKEDICRRMLYSVTLTLIFNAKYFLVMRWLQTMRGQRMSPADLPRLAHTSPWSCSCSKFASDFDDIFALVFELLLAFNCLLRCSIIRCSIIRCSIIRCAIIRCSIIRCSIIRCSIIVTFYLFFVNLRHQFSGILFLHIYLHFLLRLLSETNDVIVRTEYEKFISKYLTNK